MSWRIFTKRAGLRSFIARTIRATSACSTASKAATWQGAVADGQRAIADIQKSLPAGYRLTWGGEYSELLEAKHQMEIIGPLALLLDFHDPFRAIRQLQIPVAIAFGVVITEPVGALIALKLTAHSIQRFFGSRAPRTDGRFG